MKISALFLRAPTALALLWVLCAPAQAADGHALMSACGKDYRRVCSGVQPGGGRGAACLKQHEAELSEACKGQMESMASCGQEVKKICGADGAGTGALRTCMQTHADAFSPACRPGATAQ